MKAPRLRLLLILPQYRLQIHNPAHKRHCSRTWHEVRDTAFLVLALWVPFSMEGVHGVGELFFGEAVAGFSGRGRRIGGIGEADFGFVESLDGGGVVYHLGEEGWWPGGDVWRRRSLSMMGNRREVSFGVFN